MHGRINLKLPSRTNTLGLRTIAGNVGGCGLRGAMGSGPFAGRLLQRPTPTCLARATGSWSLDAGAIKERSWWSVGYDWFHTFVHARAGCADDAGWAVDHELPRKIPPRAIAGGQRGSISCLELAARKALTATV